MPYPSSHLYLTIHWKDSRETDEGGQVGIRFDSPATSVTQAMVDAAKPAVSTFWQDVGAAIPGWYQLVQLRLALIGENGQYVPGTFSRDGIYTTPVNGTQNAHVVPLQIASVATLTTDAPRGQASKGRIYLPPIGAALGTNGRWTIAQCDFRATAVATMLTSLGQVLKQTPEGLPAFASVFSKGTTKSAAGERRFIRGVKVGTRPDVQRRRAKQALEVYGAVKPVTGPST